MKWRKRPGISPGKRCATKSGMASPSRSSIIRANSATSEGYKKLAERLDRLDEESGTRGNRLFYFAASPEQFETIVENLQKAGLNKPREGSWARVILEKPFGTDLKSARHLNRVVQSAFTRGSDLPDRSFPRERNGAEYFGPAFRQRDLRTALEHALHRSRPDHGRGNVRRGKPRRLLRGRRCSARHGAEPSPATALPGRDGAADRSRRRQHSR